MGNLIFGPGDVLQSPGDLSLAADGNIIIRGAEFTAAGGVLISGRKVTVTGVTEKQEAWTTTQETGEVPDSATTENRDYDFSHRVKGGAVSGDRVDIAAVEDVIIVASELTGKTGIRITGRNVTIVSARDTLRRRETRTGMRNRRGLFPAGPVMDTLNSVRHSLDRAAAAQDDCLKALYLCQAGRLAGEITDNPKQDSAAFLLNREGSTMAQKFAIISEITIAPGSALASGGDIHIEATEGDINIAGVALAGRNICLTAAKSVNLKAAVNSSIIKIRSGDRTVSMGDYFSPGNSRETGCYASGSGACAAGEEGVTTFVHMLATAQDTLRIQAGRDISFGGARACGHNVQVKAGRNLRLHSKQTMENYYEVRYAADSKLNGGAGPATGSAGMGIIDAKYRSVTELTGIYAGQGGFTINVGGQTSLRGAVIAGGVAEKNHLSTETLIFTDLENQAGFHAAGFELNYSSTNGARGSGIVRGLTPALAPTVKEKAHSTTKAAVSPGTILIGGLEARPAVSRLPETALHVLDRIFDKQTVQERQELAKVFGQEAFEAAGAMARRHQRTAQAKWKQAKQITDPAKQAQIRQEAQGIWDQWGPGGTQKIRLHSLAGGLMSALSGYGFAEGAMAAGVNEALQKELYYWEKDHPAANQWVSLLIGACIGHVTGAGAALSGTKYNWDDAGHNETFREVNLYAEHKDYMVKVNHAYDISRDTQGDSVSHAMGLRYGLFNYEEDEYKKLSSAWAIGLQGTNEYKTEAEARQYGRDKYLRESEERRQAIIYRIADHIHAAIREKIINRGQPLGGGREKALEPLTWALHVTSDDFAHRQANAGWWSHAPRDWESKENITRSYVDRMDLEQNWKRAQEAVEACKVVFQMWDFFRVGEDSEEKNDYAKRVGTISKLIPVVHFGYEYDKEPLKEPIENYYPIQP